MVICILFTLFEHGYYIARNRRRGEYMASTEQIKAKQILEEALHIKNTPGFVPDLPEEMTSKEEINPGLKTNSGNSTGSTATGGSNV